MKRILARPPTGKISIHANWNDLTTGRVVKMTTTVKATASILSYAVKEFKAVLEKLKNINNLLFSLTFEPIPVSMIEQSNKRGKNAIGLQPSDGLLVVILLYTSWDDAHETERVYAIKKEALDSIDAEAKVTGTSANYRYLNYAFQVKKSFPRTVKLPETIC